MKLTAPILLAALLCGAAGAASATVHIECKTNAKGKCEVPAPPAPPVPPVPAAPPAALAHAVLPAPPALPAILPPPPPPQLPEVPAAAHAACAGKAAGSQLSYVPGKGELMQGVCERVDGKMAFVLRLYHKE